EARCRFGLRRHCRIVWLERRWRTRRRLQLLCRCLVFRSLWCWTDMTTTPTHPVTQASDEVEMQIRGLMMDPVTNMPIIVLKDIGSDLVLPIWVGIFEAYAIALELEKTAMPRPMTHDLLQNMARGLNAEVRKVVVSELRDDTFYAVIWMDHAGETVTMDARPSD